MKNSEIIKYKNAPIINYLLDTILIDKTLKSENQKDDGNENDKTLMLSKDENENDKTSMSSEDENKNKDEDKKMLLEYMEDVDDKLFKKYSDRKDFNSFLNKFDHAANEKDKEKVVKELKDK